MEKRISDRGYYPVRLTRDEVDAWAADPTLVDTRFKAEMLGNVERWMALGDERLAGHRHPLHRLAGQRRHVRDRPDHRARRASRARRGATRSTLDGFTLVSTGWANPTPWNTFRELPEPELRERIDGLVAPGARPAPRDLQLPRPAVRLEPRQRAQARRRHELRRRAARRWSPSDRSAVRESILAYGPPLSLHGHIHEGKGAVKLGSHPGGQPGQLLRGRRPPGGDRRPRCEERRR